MYVIRSDVYLKMAASELSSTDYEWEFMEPPASDFDCEMCHNVLREPFLTACCGSHFCQACIDPVVKEGKPCPSCGEGELMMILDKKTKRKIFSLDVRCPMWRRGCKWVGELGDRSDHLDEKDGDCQFVDVNCSNACGGRVQRRELPTHLKQACPKRAYVCDYCPFEATFDVVTTQHWPVCGYFPLPCPNKCDVGRVERQNLEQHLKECSLQEVECDFSYAGCQVKLHRKDFAGHMEENAQNHMRMTQGKLRDVAAGMEEKFRRDLQGMGNQIAGLQKANTNQKEKFEEKITQLQQVNADMQRNFEKKIAQLQERVKEVQDQKNRQIAEVQEALKQKDRQLAGIAAHVCEKDEQITRLVAALNERVEFLEGRVPLFEFTMPNFSSYKKEHKKWWSDAPHFYTHDGGYKMQVQTVANSAAASGVMSVYVYAVKGDFDGQLKWPVKATVTLQLIDPTGRHGPYERSEQGELKRHGSFNWYQFIAHTELEKYIHNDSLRFRVVSVKVQ